VPVDGGIHRPTRALQQLFRAGFAQSGGHLNLLETPPLLRPSQLLRVVEGATTASLPREVLCWAWRATVHVARFRRPLDARTPRLRGAVSAHLLRELLRLGTLSLQETAVAAELDDGAGLTSDGSSYLLVALHNAIILPLGEAPEVRDELLNDSLAAMLQENLHERQRLEDSSPVFIGFVGEYLPDELDDEASGFRIMRLHGDTLQLAVRCSPVLVRSHVFQLRFQLPRGHPLLVCGHYPRDAVPHSERSF